jgi:hypothetical protein
MNHRATIDIVVLSKALRRTPRSAPSELNSDTADGDRDEDKSFGHGWDSKTQALEWRPWHLCWCKCRGMVACHEQWLWRVYVPWRMWYLVSSVPTWATTVVELCERWLWHRELVTEREELMLGVGDLFSNSMN